MSHNTLTGSEWARALPKARKRRAPEAVRARVFSGPACPVCGCPGLHRDMTGGTEILHDAHTRCWWPQGCAVHPAFGNVTNTEGVAA